MTVAPPPTPPVRPTKPWPLRWYMWVFVYVPLFLCLLGGLAVLSDDTEEPEADVAAETADDPGGAVGEPDGGQPDRPEDLFESVSHSGTGDDIIDLPDGAAKGFVTASHDGESNFAISVLDTDNETTGDLMVNTIGAYEGSTAFGLHSLGGEPARLQVTADGAWEITVASFADAPVLELPTDGKGDAVFWYPGGVASWQLTHDGESNFIVDATSAMMGLVNEIGPYDGTVAVGADAAVVTIVADGAWTITPQ